MPGYELTELWLTEEGLPKKGIWDVTYYAGEGKGLKECKPMVKFRKSLLQLVLIEECEVVTDADRDDAEKRSNVMIGPAFITANPGNQAYHIVPVYWSHCDDMFRYLGRVFSVQ